MYKAQQHPERFYFVEGNKIVHLKDNGILEIDSYVKVIKINHVQDILNRHANFFEIKEFADWYIFENDFLSVDVVLHSESNYYDVLRKMNLAEYIEIVENIWITINKPLSMDYLNIVDDMMSVFQLNLYSIAQKKHYKNIDEFKSELIRLHFLKYE